MMTTAAESKPIPTTTENRPSIRTFAVFDLETTGLKTNSAQITEMAVVAVTRENFLAAVDAKNGPATPRALAKICLPIEPNIPVEFQAAKVSGLNNALLKDCNDFKTAFAAFCTFLSRLPAPVCLIAHNGQKFDFALFKNELLRNGLSMPDGVLRFDSMLELPKIDQSFLSLAEISNSGKRNKTEEHVLDDRPDEPEVEQIGQKLAEMPQSPIYKYTIDRGSDVVETWRSPPPPVLADENRRKSPLPLQNGSNRSTKRNLFENDCFATSPNDCLTNFTKINDRQELQLHEDFSAAKNFVLKYGPPPRRGLDAIYEHFFDEKPPAAHTADGDCTALLRILMFYGRDFVRVLHSQAQPF